MLFALPGVCFLRPCFFAATEIRLREADAVGGEHLPDLRRRHGQVGCPQFEHLPGQPVPVQRQQGIAAGGQDEAQPRLPAAYQAVQALQDVGMGKHVSVIHDYDEPAWVRQPTEEGLDEINPGPPRARPTSP